MEEYRIYIIGPDGHVIGRTDLLCEDEDAAKERARQLLDGYDLEVWQGSRRLASFKHG